MSPDQEFLASFEQGTLPPAQFKHVAHVRLAYLYLREHDFPTALARISGAIKRYAARLGKQDLYHETITVVFLALIQERLRVQGDGGSFAEFAQQNPQLFTRDALQPYYTAQELKSEAARRMFLLPQVRAVAQAKCAQPRTCDPALR